MPVAAQPEMDEVEDRRRAGEPYERAGVLGCSTGESVRLNRHGVKLFGAQRGVREQALTQVGEVAIRVARGRDAFIDLHHVDTIPGNLLVRQGAQHLPGGVSTTDSDNE